jgi:uncharacterized protein YjdB
VEGGGAGTVINDEGLLTVAAGENALNLIVRATSTVDPTRSGTAAVTVIAVTGVTVNPDAISVVKGQTQTFAATVQGTNNPAQTVTWSVEGGGAGTVINDEGLLTVAAGESALNLTVRATSTVDPGKSGTAAVKVMSVTGVTVSPAAASVAKGQTQPFTALVEGTNNPAQTVTWSVEGGGTGTTINNEGFLTVAIGESALNLIVRATSTVDPTKSGTAAVTVIAVTGVTVSPAAASVAKGQSFTFTATVQGNNNPAQTVTWSVEGGGTGTVISGNGTLTIAAGEGATSLTVRATSTIDTTKSGAAAVTIKGEGSIILVYPTDAASGELGELSSPITVTAAGPVSLTTNREFDTYRWLVDGFVKGKGRTFTLNAGGYSPGAHQLSLEVSLNGIPYSKSGAFTVQ